MPSFESARSMERDWTDTLREESELPAEEKKSLDMLMKRLNNSTNFDFTPAQAEYYYMGAKHLKSNGDFENLDNGQQGFIENIIKAVEDNLVEAA